MAKEQQIKCVVWDLDNTLWKGTLIEDTHVTVDPAAVQLIKTLDERGILQSVASKNDADLAMNKLHELGLAEYFLYPQIHWDSKSVSIQSIAKEINIGIDSIAFIDDQAYEREEVTFHHPLVMTIDAADLHTVADIPQMIPRFVTDDSRIRRQMYQSDIKRKEVEDSYAGAQDEFLATLNMELTITRAQPEDLRRAEELTQRTNQLNTTAYTYDYDELEFFSKSPNHILLVAGLTDKYGTYGKIGLVLIEKTADAWVIKLLLMSCRVMSRGVGTVLITYIRNMAAQNGARLLAEFVSNDRNRMMYMTYKFNQFKEVEKKESWSLLENDLNSIPPYPSYMGIITDSAVQK
jgi:FkbH-like protein